MPLRVLFQLVVVVCSLVLGAASLDAAASSPVRVDSLAVEHLQNPIGIGVQHPRLSWKLKSKRAGEIQTAFQIQAASARPELNRNNPKPDLWDSGKTVSDQSVLVPWNGKPLESRSQVFWRVRVWDKDDRVSDWSEIASFELGLLNSSNDWKGQWITADLPRHDILQSALARASWINAGSAANEAAAVRFALILPAGAVVRRATLDAAADGLLTIYVNGQPNRQGSSSRTAPLFADITSQLSPGTNVIAIGSAAVRNANRGGNIPGRNAVAAGGSIELQDGRRIELNTDGSWKAAVNPATNWFAPIFDESSWQPATVLGSYTSSPSRYSDNTIGPGRYLRKSFVAKAPIRKARLYATALGVYEAWINGTRINHDSLFDPGWTDYRKRVMVQTYDVTSILSRGQNTIGAVLSDGWYAGRLGWMGLAQYGPRPSFSAQLEITYADGSSEMVATDNSWKAGPGEIVGSDPQWGEIIDARKNATGWAEPGFKETLWTNAVVESHNVVLVPQLGPPVRRIRELSPRQITRRGSSWIVDFGQNLVGIVRLSVRGSPGTVVTLRHAETLNADGALYTENLRPALSTDTFILRGGGRETFEPHFTFHGFRYVEISGYPGKLQSDDLRGIVVSSDTPQIGSWESSDADLNRLHENILWSQRGNFLSVPTDCPQRDERMGWMGDAQVFAPTAAANADVASFFSKWMVDVNDAQDTNGAYSDVSPRVARPQPAWPVWGDAGVIIPWTMYLNCGDKAFLADNYDVMVRWLEFNVRRSNNLILSGGVGDHLAPRRTPVEVVDTAYFANSANIVARSAGLLGRTEDAAKYEKLSRDIIAAFNNAFVSTNGMIRGDTQTAYILALRFNLLPDELRVAAAQRLAENVQQNGHLTTGFVGVGLICPTLSDIGRSDLAWQLVLTNTYPSWLFSVKNGATTIWERWDGWTPDRGFQDSSMNSFNHYSFGSVGAWLYSGAAGIRLDESHPGYKHFFLQPQLTSRLSHVRSTLDSPYGLILSHWYREGDRMFYDVTVPPNASADLILPVPISEVRQSGKPLAGASVRSNRIFLSAGSYKFSFPAERIP